MRRALGPGRVRPGQHGNGERNFTARLCLSLSLCLSPSLSVSPYLCLSLSVSLLTGYVGASGGHLGTVWAHLGASWAHLRAGVGRSLGHPGGLKGPSSVTLKKTVLGRRFGATMGLLGAIFGAVWIH